MAAAEYCRPAAWLPRNTAGRGVAAAEYGVQQVHQDLTTMLQYEAAARLPRNTLSSIVLPTFVTLLQ